PICVLSRSNVSSNTSDIDGDIHWTWSASEIQRMKSSRTWWLFFSAGALIVMIALGWVTARVLELESREAQARSDAQYQEALRLALWRMDSWFAPRLAREAARPYFEYLSYYPQERAYTRILNEISKGEVLTPSPLLTFTSEYFPIHFQVNDD